MCFSSCLLIHSFVCQNSLPFYWYCYNQKQSSRAVLQKRCLQISQNSQEKTKKGFRYRCFLVNSAKFLITTFLKNPSDGYFCINTRSVYCPTTTFRLFKNDVTHIFWLSIFPALIFPVIFKTLSQKPIFNPVKHLRWRFPCENS